jgi:predicted extracellular nuclease
MKTALIVIPCLMAGLCAPPPDSGDDTDGDGDLPAACANGNSIADIQEGGFADGDPVTVGCAVVTAELTPAGEGFFLQDPEGGAWSGIYVYLYGGMDPEDLDIGIGDLVTVAGTISEWNDLTEISIATAYDVAKVGTWDVTVDAVDCGTKDWERWEGCLISVDGLEMTSWPDSYGEVTTSCGITVDDLYGDYGGGTGAVCTPIVAPLTYTYGAFKLVPRDELDVAGCTDPADVEASTIAEIRQGDPQEGDFVALEGVVVTSPLTPDGEMFFVQDAGGGPHTGLAIYLGSQTFEAEPSMSLDIAGTLTDYYGMLELQPATIEDTGASGPLAPAILDEAPADWEVWESNLVTLTEVQITSDPDTYGEVETNYGITINDLFYDAGLGDGDSYAAVTGIIEYSYDAYKLEPRDADDLVR